MPVSSPHPWIDIPEVDIFDHTFNRKVIFRDAETNRTYTYSQVLSASLDFAEGLKSTWDFRKGDVLALFSPNSIDTPIVTYGTLWTGAIVSPANPGYTPKELAYQLKDCGARAIATQWALLDTVRKACKLVGLGEEAIILLGDERDPQGRFKHWTSVRNISGTSRYRKAKINAKTDVAFLVYSSGTTGTPKGVMLSHYNIIANMVQGIYGEGGNLTWDGSKTEADVPLPAKGSGGDKILAVLPMFHVYGLLNLIHQPLHVGFEALVMSRFDLDKFCSVIQEQRITYAYLVPPIVLLLAKHPAVEKYDLSSIRMSSSGAAPLSKDLVDSVFKRTGIRVRQGYGLSETSPTASQQRFQDWQTKVGSVGWLFPNMEAKFCAVASASSGKGSDADAELPPGEIGELYLRGPNVFLGYHNRPAETAECLSPDGWFRTGDVGFIDEQANLYITDRVKELIKYKGFQVPPAELEAYLINHELVDDVAVIGVESTELGTEVPRAYVMRKGGLDAAKLGDEEAIIRWLSAQVANHKRLRGGLKFVQTIPKSPSGKLLRRVLKEEARKEYKQLEEAKQHKSLKARL